LCDNDLVEALRRGDADAQQRLWRDHQKELVAALRRSPGLSAEDAEDVVGEVLAGVLAPGAPVVRSFRGGSLRAFLLTVVRCDALDLLRRRARESPLEAETEHPGHVASSARNDPPLDRSTVFWSSYQDCLEELAERVRAAWVGRWVGAEFEELAALLGLSASRARAIVAQARAQLARCMGKKGYLAEQNGPSSR